MLWDAPRVSAEIWWPYSSSCWACCRLAALSWRLLPGICPGSSCLVQSHARFPQGSLRPRLANMCLLRLGPFAQLGLTSKGHLASELPLGWIDVLHSSFFSVLPPSHPWIPGLILGLLLNIFLYANLCLRVYFLRNATCDIIISKWDFIQKALGELLRHYI